MTIGGPFSLVDHRGVAVTERHYLGKPTLVFFGFTHCPDVCPTTLLELTNRLNALGPDSSRLNVLFVTVDPERDTPKALNSYLSAFHPGITGLTGETAAIDATVAAYRVYAKRVPLDGGDYTMDHTATVFTMDARGQFAGTISYQEAEDTALAKIKRLLSTSP